MEIFVKFWPKIKIFQVLDKIFEKILFDQIL